MSSFAFKQEIGNDASTSSSLSETMQIDGDHVVINYETTFQGPRDIADIKEKFRVISPEFSNDAQHMRDVQVVMDENYLNYIFYNFYHREKHFSVKEKLFNLIPESVPGAA